jgi:hypothetical protein
VSADVVRRGATRAIYAKQNDKNSRFLNVRIQEDGTDIEVKQTSKVIFNVERPDTKENMFEGTVNEDGSVKIPLTSWMLELDGTLLCDISIISEGSDVAKLTTMQFNIYVEAAVVSDESFIDTEEYSIIVDLLKRTDAAEKVASSAAANAAKLRSECEDATSAAVEAARQANNIRENIEAGGYIESLKEQNTGSKFTVWVGTQDEFDAIPVSERLHNCLYIYTDKVPPTNTLFKTDSYQSAYDVTDVIDISDVKDHINNYEAFIIDLHSGYANRTISIMACRTPSRGDLTVYTNNNNVVDYIEGSVIVPANRETSNGTMFTYTGIYLGYVCLAVLDDDSVEVVHAVYTSAGYNDLQSAQMSLPCKVSGIHGISSRKGSV